MMSAITLFDFLFRPDNITKDSIKNKLHFREVVIIQMILLGLYLGLEFSIGIEKVYVEIMALVLICVVAIPIWMLEAYIVFCIDKKKIGKIPNYRYCLRAMCAEDGFAMLMLPVSYIINKTMGANEKIFSKIIGVVTTIFCIYIILYYFKKIFNYTKDDIRLVGLFLVGKEVIIKLINLIL